MADAWQLRCYCCNEAKYNPHRPIYDCKGKQVGHASFAFAVCWECLDKLEANDVWMLTDRFLQREEPPKED